MNFRVRIEARKRSMLHFPLNPSPKADPPSRAEGD
jgi:hypothetical protein